MKSKFIDIGKTQNLFSKYISFWIKRMLFLFLTFIPIISIHYLFSKYLNEVLVSVRYGTSWRFIIVYFICTALVLYIIEQTLIRKDFLRNSIQRLARYAPLIIGIISFATGILCFYRLYEIKILSTPNHQDAIITYIFYTYFFTVLPVLCHIPVLLIVSKAANDKKDKKYLFGCLFNFYKILYLEHSVAISFGLVILSISIGANFLQPASVSNNNVNAERMAMWQLCLAIVRVIAPVILILTFFGEDIKNFEKLFESDFYRKLRSIISSMHKHTVLLGYGYLGKDVLGELKEREIVIAKQARFSIFKPENTKNPPYISRKTVAFGDREKGFSYIITPSLERRKIYKNLLILDKNQVVFNSFTSDPVYGSIGVIEPELESERLSINYLNFRKDEFESDSTINILCKDFEGFLPTNENTENIKRLNALLETPDFYTEFAKKKYPLKPSEDKDIVLLIRETENYRSKKYLELSADQQYDIKRLNRLILETNSPHTPKISQREPPVLAAGIIGDVINKSTYEKAKIHEAKLLISAIADYDATNKLVEFLPDKTCNSIITVQDLQQLKLLLHNKVETNNSGTIILLHPSYIEGISLGRVLLSAASRWIISKRTSNSSSNPSEKTEPSPKIVVSGGGKQIYYLTETYLLGLRQIMGYSLRKLALGETNSNICILSDDEFYKKKVSKKTYKDDLKIDTGQWVEVMKSPSTCYTNDVISWDVLFREPDDVYKIKMILKNSEYKPDIVVISHKRADYVIKILDAWINTIINSGEVSVPPVILVGTKGKEIKIERLLAKYHEYLDRKIKENNPLQNGGNELNKLLYSFPTQKYDAMVKVYDDAREQIGSIAKSLISKEPVSLHFCVKNHPGTLAKICNELAGFDITPIENEYKDKKKPSFLNITVQKCPGSPSEASNQRFLIESDVILEVSQDADKTKDHIICNGLVVPTKHEEVIHGLLKSKHTKCYDNYCIYREQCKTELDPVTDSPPNGKETSFAKLYLCSNGYDTPGSVAHVLNNLLFAKTKISNEVVDTKIANLIYTRSYYSFNPGIHKKEFYGNIVPLSNKLKNDRGKLCENSCISFISLLPVINQNDEWQTYMADLSTFLAKYNNQENCYLPKNQTDNTCNIISNKHGNVCPGTCVLAKRCKSMSIEF